MPELISLGSIMVLFGFFNGLCRFDRKARSFRRFADRWNVPIVPVPVTPSPVVVSMRPIVPAAALESVPVYEQVLPIAA